MRRWAFHILAGFSLLLAVAAAVMWVRSYRPAPEWIGYIWLVPKEDHVLRTFWAIDSGEGGICFETANIIIGDSRHRSRTAQQTVRTFYRGFQWWQLQPRSRSNYPFKRPDRTSLGRSLGFEFHSSSTPSPVLGRNHSYLSVTVPYWFLILWLALLPGRQVFIFYRNRSRRRRGLCIACGYDLRASEARCPECGTPFVRKHGRAVPAIFS
jgi:hypothetical protein